jgi:phosphoglycolate phosphatase-like HAD superfamily hydrolase
MASPVHLTWVPGAASVSRLLASAAAVFWDFDGVIKDSVNTKAEAFEHLFRVYGSAVAARVREHHEAHGGMSRYEKMPLYLRWAGESGDAAQVSEFCLRFSQLVFHAVIDAPWVPGVREYLYAHHGNQPFFLVTATPEQEIRSIVAETKLSHCFRAVYGAPGTKTSAIQDALRRWSFPPTRSLMIGDSSADLLAAEASGLLFILRCTSYNRDLQQRYRGPAFSELSYE